MYGSDHRPGANLLKQKIEALFMPLFRTDSKKNDKSISVQGPPQSSSTDVKPSVDREAFDTKTSSIGRLHLTA